LTWVGYYNHSRFNAERYHAFERIIGKSFVTSTQETLDDSQVLLYPNPSNDHLNIEINASDVDLQSIGLYDINGRLMKVFYTGSNQSRIDISGLSTGMYHLKMLSNKGLVATKSFIKSN